MSLPLRRNLFCLCGNNVFVSAANVVNCRGMAKLKR